MKKMHMFLLVLLHISGLLLSSQTADAQVNPQIDQETLFREHKKNAKLTRKSVEANRWKEAKKLAKQYKKDGWKPVPGSPSLEMQQNDMLLHRYYSQGNSPRYILGVGQAIATTSGVARKHSLARARAELASNISTKIGSLIKESMSNIEYSREEQETVGKLVDANMTKIEQSIGRTDIIFEAYREMNGSTEVIICISYDGKKAKQDVLNALEEENKELFDRIKHKLEDKE